jgi:hypothetical protein
MARWYPNLGGNRNLLVSLSGGPASYQIDVYVVARFVFMYSPGASPWESAQIHDWKRRFANMVYATWSERWELISDISCAVVDTDRLDVRLPRARVRVHVVDLDNSSVRLPAVQRIYAIHVYRPAPGERRQRQHADFRTSDMTAVEARQDGADLDDASRAELYEDSLEARGNPQDSNQQCTAMHEFGHMLGLMHPNDMEFGCSQDRNAAVCYGQAYSPESGSIMGRGMEVRRDDYRVFLSIISRLVSRVPSSSYFSADHRLHWSVEGMASDYCNGELGRRAQFMIGGHGTQGRARRPGPVTGLV